MAALLASSPALKHLEIAGMPGFVHPAKCSLVAVLAAAH